MKLTDFIRTEALIPQLKSSKRDDVIEELVDAVIAAGALDKALRQDVIDQIIEREKRGSTGFGRGVAVPHVKHKKIKKMVATIGVSEKGVDFNALDKAPVYSVVLLMSPLERPDEHLQAMENIFRNLQKEMFRKFLRQATTTAEIVDLIRETDGQPAQT